MLALTARSVRSVLFAHACLVLPCTIAAQTVTVGPSGSGAMFSTISAGIAAAPPGGIVLVAAGTYIEPATLLVDKPLTLLGAGSATTVHRAAIGGAANARLPLRVSGLLSGEKVVVAGLGLVSEFPSSFGAAVAVVVENCAGPVVLADVAGGGLANESNAATAAIVEVRDSAMVTIDACRFVATNAGPGVTPPAGLLVVRSLVHVNASQVQGASTYIGFAVAVPADGAPGIAAVDATVRIARTRVQGGSGTQVSPLIFPSIATRGGAAVSALASTVLIRGGSNNELRGGRGGTSFVAPFSGPGGPALFLYATSIGSTTPDVVAIPGANGDLTVTTPAIDGPGLLAELAFPLVSVAAAPTLVGPGNTVAFNLAGEAGAFVLPLLALGQVAAFTMPDVLGVFTLDPATLVSMPLTVLDTNGVASVPLTVPAAPTLVGITAYSQALAFAPSGWISVSGPTTFAVR